MRRLLTIDCAGAELGATLDPAEGETALLMVTGGTQTRIGSHRMYERLARALAERGIACLRFDRRGVGDSGGEDPDFRGSGPDIAAAAARLRQECAGVRRIYGFGLCDGASALALFGRESELAGLVLVNPWLVEAESGSPPPAAIRRHYRERLLSREGWKKIMSGAVDYRKLMRGVLKIARPQSGGSPLGRDVAEALANGQLPARLILARRDATAIAAEQEIKSTLFKGLLSEPRYIESDSHTFARPGDEDALLEAVTEALQALEAQYT